MCLNPGKRRSAAGIQAKRLVSARGRLLRIARLVRVVREARKLVTTGSFPQALWGHVSQGIAPTVVDRFRTRVAAAIRVCQSARCRVTAIASAFGQDSGPAVKVAREQVSSWLSLWNNCPDLRADIRVAWVIPHERGFGEGGPNWNKVTGPMIATMAILHGYGWKVRNLDLWIDPSGQNWAVDSGADSSEFVGFVAESVSVHLWKVASLFWEGGGLAAGLDASATLVHHRYLTRTGHSPGMLAMLEAFLSGVLA